MSSSSKVAAVFAIALAAVVSGGCGDDDGPGTPDAGSGGDVDSGGGPTTCPRVDFFCSNHSLVCMFGDGAAQYADDGACREAFCSYSAEKMACVENAIGRSSEMPEMYCLPATGQDYCADL